MPLPRVDGHLAPVVDAADVLPGVLRPRVVPELARPRHGVERPHQLARDDVVGADVAGRRHVAFASRAADDDEVLEHLAGDARLDVADARRVAAVEADAQVDDAVRAERHDRLAGSRVDLLQQAVHREDQPLVAAVGALPVVHAAAGHAGHALAHPALFSGRRVERDQRAVAAASVDHAAHDDGTAAGVAERVGPGHLQAGDVIAGDLRRWEVARVVRAVAVAGPPTVGRRLRCGYREGGARCQSGKRQKGPPAVRSDSVTWRRIIASCPLLLRIAQRRVQILRLNDARCG